MRALTVLTVSGVLLVPMLLAAQEPPPEDAGTPTADSAAPPEQTSSTDAEAAKPAEETSSTDEQVKPPEEETATAEEGLDTSELDSLGLEELLDITVVSASRQAEPLREAPVPITVITSEMIRAINAQNLEQVLTTYVPGMVSIEDTNEENVAFRGIYASSQQKFLVMINGHRINHRAYLVANPDEGISVNPNYVKQIEVLRGPGSSVYGNVALNAVVNIITKSGAEIDGAHVRASLGNYGQRSADFTYGASVSADSDLVVWGNVFDADGEEFDYSADTQWVGDLATETPTGGSAFLNAVGSPIAHDVGMQFTKGAWTLLATHRSGRHSDPFSTGGRSGDLYDRDVFRTFQQQAPGLTQNGASARFTFDDDLTENFNLRVDLAYDRNSVVAPFATNSANNGVIVNWNEDAYSLIAQGRLYYDAGSIGDGNVLVGTHADVWWLRDSALLSYTAGELDSVLDSAGNRLLRKGQEGSYSGFAQLKHAFSDSLLVNIGARFDYKTRRRGSGVDPNEPEDVDDITVLNPRLAVLYSPTSYLDLKLSYADAFVDSPYWYRYNLLPTFAGSVGLEPERYRSLQFTPTIRVLDGRLTNTLNISWNQLRDGIYRVPDAVEGDAFYLNSGVLESISIEEEIAFIESWYRLRANAAFFYVTEVEEYTAFDEDSPRDFINARDSGNRVWNVPDLTANLIIDVNPFQAVWDHAWLNVTVQYIGPRQGPVNRVSNADPDLATNRLNEESGVVLVNAGVRFTDIVVEGLNLHVYGRNLLNEEWFQGGSTAFPYPQPGFWYTAQLEYRFTP